MGRKRKDSSLIPNHNRPLVSCRICKAPATGFHYGIDACGACKGFFYRSITQHIYYRCEKNNNCTIDFKDVKFCQKCRYAKCLAYGMSKTASKIGRNSLLGRTGDTIHNYQTDLDTTLSPVSDTEPSPAKRPCSRLQNPADTNMPDSTDLCLIHTPSGLRNSQSPISDLLAQSSYSSLSSSSTASSLSDLSLTPRKNDYPLLTTSSSSESNDSNHWTSLDIAKSDVSSLQLKSLSLRMASPVWQKADSTTLSYSPLSSESWTHNSNNAKTHIQLCPPPLAQTQTILPCDTPSPEPSPGDQSECFTHHPLSKIPIQVQGLPHTVSSSSSGVSSSELTDLPHISDSSADNKINQELPDLRALSLVDKSTTEVMEKLSELYADSDSIVRKFLETERKTFRFKGRDLSSRELLDEQLNHKESCICRTKLFGRQTFLEESEYEDVLNNTGLDIDDRKQYVSKKFNYLEDLIIGIATFAKTIPGFKYVPLEQKAKLIKYARWEVCVISAIQLTNPHLMVSVQGHRGWVCPLDYDEEAASAFVVPAIRLMGRMQKLSLTEEELVIMMAMALVSPDRTEPTNSMLVARIHGHLVDLLLKRLKQNHDQPMRLFANIVAMFTELRTLQPKISSTFMKRFKNTVQVELRERPLAQEMIPALSYQENNN